MRGAAKGDAVVGPSPYSINHFVQQHTTQPCHADITTHRQYTRDAQKSCRSLARSIATISAVGHAVCVGGSRVYGNRVTHACHQPFICLDVEPLQLGLDELVPPDKAGLFLLEPRHRLAQAEYLILAQTAERRNVAEAHSYRCYACRSTALVAGRSCTSAAVFAI